MNDIELYKNPYTKQFWCCRPEGSKDGWYSCGRWMSISRKLIWVWEWDFESFDLPHGSLPGFPASQQSVLESTSDLEFVILTGQSAKQSFKQFMEQRHASIQK